MNLTNDLNIEIFFKGIESAMIAAKLGKNPVKAQLLGKIWMKKKET